MTQKRIRFIAAALCIAFAVLSVAYLAEKYSSPETYAKSIEYAATDEAIQPDNIYQMSGNKIGVRTLDLNRDFSEIAALFEPEKDFFFVSIWC